MFLPDYTTGEVWIIDLAKSAVIGKPNVLGNTGKFQLLTRDGVVFYNDSLSDKAGVIELDGRFTPVTKYDATNPTSRLTPVRPTPRPRRAQPAPSPRKIPTPQRIHRPVTTTRTSRKTPTSK